MWLEHWDFKKSFKVQWEGEEVQGCEGYKFKLKLGGVKQKNKTRILLVTSEMREEQF